MHKRCIYCGNVEKNGKPWKGEHVISKLLGGPDAYQLYKEVCNSCNKKFGETIENVFRERSPEGYFACVYQLGRGSGYMTCSRDFGVEVETEQGNLSPDLFFHIDLQTEALRIPPQITFRAGSHHRYTIFESISASKLAEKLKWFRSKTIEAVAYGNVDRDPLATAKAEGFELSEIEHGETIPAGTNLGAVKFKFQFKRDRAIKRVAAKIAFNYLAWCAGQKYQDVVFSSYFNDLRKFVLLPDPEFDRQFGLERTLVTYEPRKIIYSGQELRPGRPFHRLKLAAEKVYVDGVSGLSPGYYWTIVCRVNFFSLGDYVVRLAFWPFETVFEPSRFGCEHLLDLKTSSLVRLKRNGEIDELNDFRLFNASAFENLRFEM